MASMSVYPISAWQDNYMYLLVDEISRTAAAVDPVEPEKILQEVKKRELSLEKVLTTHHHSDHASGNAVMKSLLPNVSIVGGDSRIPSIDTKVSDGTELNLGSLKITCLHTPCHTSGHICYYATDKTGKGVVFTGDTLFIGGCGRFFEGTAEQMYEALINCLGRLPDTTEVYCGHEYTINNLRFASTVEPNNNAISDMVLWAQNKRAAGEPTVPSTIGKEREINPFFRINVSEVQKFTETEGNPMQTMEKLREQKNNFS